MAPHALTDARLSRCPAHAHDPVPLALMLRAFRWVREPLRDPGGLPLSVRLLCGAHRLLLDGARGAGKQPGELRRSQNWTGGARPGRAVFVPPPPDRVPALLADLERFIHSAEPALPPLVRMALVHVQFETLHSFLDGNGRIGRLLIAAMLAQWGLLAEPLVPGHRDRADRPEEEPLLQPRGRCRFAGRHSLRWRQVTAAAMPSRCGDGAGCACQPILSAPPPPPPRAHHHDRPHRPPPRQPRR
jgi:hypothetical protein